MAKRISRKHLLRRIAELSTNQLGQKDWGYRWEKNGIGDYGRDEHYRKLDDSIKFGLRITYNPPECTVLYFSEAEDDA